MKANENNVTNNFAIGNVVKTAGKIVADAAVYAGCGATVGLGAGWATGQALDAAMKEAGVAVVGKKKFFMAPIDYLTGKMVKKKAPRISRDIYNPGRAFVSGASGAIATEVAYEVLTKGVKSWAVAPFEMDLDDLEDLVDDEI